MPRNGSGVYSLPSGYLAVPGTTIRADQHNPPLEDIASALTGSIPRDGTAPMLGDLPMNGRKVTGLGAGVADSDAARMDQIPTFDPKLQALADMDDTPGLLAQTGAETFAKRTLTGTADQILVTNGAGTAGNPTIAIDLSTNADFTVDPSKPTTRAAIKALVAAYAATVTDVTGSRAHSTTYTNATGKPFQIVAYTYGPGAVKFQLSPDAVTWTDIAWATGSGLGYSTTFWVPNGYSWRINGTVTVGFVQQIEF